MLAQDWCVANFCSLCFGSVLLQEAMLKSASGEHAQRNRGSDGLDQVLLLEIYHEVLNNLLELLVHMRTQGVQLCSVFPRHPESSTQPLAMTCKA